MRNEAGTDGAAVDPPALSDERRRRIEETSDGAVHAGCLELRLSNVQRSMALVGGASGAGQKRPSVVTV